MLIRGTLTLRNEVVISKREALTLTQKQAAELACISIDHYARIERLDFSSRTVDDDVIRIAGAFDLDMNDIAPPELIGHQIGAKAVQVSSVTPGRLLECTNPSRFILPSPADEAERIEVRNALKEAMAKMLTLREREILDRRYGLDSHDEQSYGQIGRELKITKERVRQIEMKAIRKLQFPAEQDPNPLAKHERDLKLLDARPGQR